jgi:phosphate transport system protein
MGELASAMIDVSIEAFTKREPSLCERLGELDEEVDELNRSLLGQVVASHDDEARLSWAIRMLQVSRYLERAADHAVDIGEQVWFLTTGELRELD